MATPSIFARSWVDPVKDTQPARPVPATVILFGPQGTGKTRHAEALRLRLGCVRIVDEWFGEPLLPGDLALTNMSLLDLQRVNPQHLPAGTQLVSHIHIAALLRG